MWKHFYDSSFTEFLQHIQRIDDVHYSHALQVKSVIQDSIENFVNLQASSGITAKPKKFQFQNNVAEYVIMIEEILSDEEQKKCALNLRNILVVNLNRGCNISLQRYKDNVNIIVERGFIRITIYGSLFNYYKEKTTGSSLAILSILPGNSIILGSICVLLFLSMGCIFSASLNEGILPQYCNLGLLN